MVLLHFLPFCQKLSRSNKEGENIRNRSRNRNCKTPKQTEYICDRPTFSGVAQVH